MISYYEEGLNEVDFELDLDLKSPSNYYPQSWRQNSRYLALTFRSDC